MFSGSVGRRVQMEDVLCQLLTNQTRMVEATLGQRGTVIAGVAGLLHAVHQTGVVHEVPPQVVVSPPPPPVPPPAELEPDEGEADAEAVEVDRPSRLPEALRIIIEKATEKAVALIFEKITSGEGVGGLPLAAVQDLLGHASIVITQRYAHLAPHVSQDAVCLLDGPGAAPSERPAPLEPMPKAPAPVAPTRSPAAPARVKTSREARADRTKARAEARSVAKNRQETPPVPLLN